MCEKKGENREKHADVMSIEYPGIHDLSSRYSMVCQRRYKIFAAVNLLALTASSAIGLFSAYFWKTQIISILLIIIAVVAFLFQEYSRNYGDWFDARAVAESVKTASWRFAVKARPYGVDLSEGESIRLFGKEMEEITAGRKELISQFDYPNSSESFSYPTESMRALRLMGWQDRKRSYLMFRLTDQYDWYGKKAALNAKRQRGWSAVVILLQIAAVAASVAAVMLGLDFSAAFLTAASAALAWLQVQQRKMLAHSYGVAAGELAMIRDKMYMVNDEEGFTDMAAEAELAMSREHTLWISRNRF